MSQVHNVQSGDTLGAIAIRYLGSWNKWTEILGTNPQLLNRKKAVDGSPLIFSGDVLLILEDETTKPLMGTTPKKTIVVNEKDGDKDVSIVVDGVKFTGFTSYEINLSYDSFDTFSFSAPYDTAIKEMLSAIMPFAFKSCEVYYADTLLFKGVLLTPDPELANTSSEITLQGYPICATLNDCMIPSTNYPLAVDMSDGVTIKDVADAACGPYNVPVIFEGEVGAGFSDMSIEPTDKIMDVLSRLAKERNLLFTNNERGQLVFFNAKKEKAFVSFAEGKAPLISVKSKFKAQEFYSHITGYSKTDSEHEYAADSFTFENKYLISKGVLRHKNFIVEDSESASLENAVKAEAGRMFAECCALDVECEGHVNEKGEVFQKGMTVCVCAPSAMITRETDFIARNVKLSRTTEGKTASLSLVFSGVYTGDIPETLPWE